MCRNKYRVGKGMWDKWSEQGKESFNSYYKYFKSNQEFFLHPKGIINSKEHWDTTAWNMAWILAEAVTAATKGI